MKALNFFYYGSLGLLLLSVLILELFSYDSLFLYIAINGSAMILYLSEIVMTYIDFKKGEVTLGRVHLLTRKYPVASARGCSESCI